MKRPASVFVILCGLVSLWPAAVPPAAAQPILERLERRIRDRLNKTDPPGQPSERPAGEAPKRATAEKPADGAGADDRKQPGYLGVVVDDKQDRDRGVRILAVRPGGPADKAGLRQQDLITSVAGIRVRQMSDMAEVLDRFHAGDSLVLDILRGETQLATKVTMGRRPQRLGQAARDPAGTAAPAADGLPAEAPPEVPNAADASVKKPVPSSPVGPHLRPPDTPGRPPNAAAEMKQLRRRIEQLERRVAELERMLAEALKRP